VSTSSAWRSPRSCAPGADQINVNLPDVKNAGEAEQQVGQVAQMFFYDWEKNVLGDNGQPAPSDPSVTGDGQPGRAPRRGRCSSR
jgi:hypothetical protein